MNFGKAKERRHFKFQENTFESTMRIVALRWLQKDASKLTDVINRAVCTSKKKKGSRCIIARYWHYILDLEKEKQLLSPLSSFIKVQRNFDLTKCQGTGEIGSLYRGSFPYITLLLG